MNSLVFQLSRDLVAGLTTTPGGHAVPAYAVVNDGVEFAIAERFGWGASLMSGAGIILRPLSSVSAAVIAMDRGAVTAKSWGRLPAASRETW